jgi:hypothetical protein
MCFRLPALIVYSISNRDLGCIRNPQSVPIPARMRDAFADAVRCLPELWERLPIATAESETPSEDLRQIRDVTSGLESKLYTPDSQHPAPQLSFLPATGLPNPAAEASACIGTLTDPATRIRRLCSGSGCLHRLPAICPACPRWACRTGHRDWRPDLTCRRRSPRLGHPDRDTPVEPRAELDRPLGPHPRGRMDGLRPSPFRLHP